MSEWWEAFWFFLPAGVANLVPAITAKVPVLNNWNTPMDFGRSWRGVRIFGDHKTWRGIVSGTVLAALVGLFQYRFIAYSAESAAFIIIATAAMGFGALLGDAIESFFKRRRGISEGKSWFPYDQIDYIVGGLVIVSPLVDLAASQVARIFVIYFVLHLAVGYVSYLAGLKKTPV